jgi:hypothetical protein
MFAHEMQKEKGDRPINDMKVLKCYQDMSVKELMTMSKAKKVSYIARYIKLIEKTVRIMNYLNYPIVD